MPRRSLSTSIVVVALIAAIAIWLAYAIRALQPDSGLVPPGNEGWLIGLLAIGIALDALVGARVVGGRTGAGNLVWLGLRTLLSAVGFLFLTLPLYAIALFALTRSPRVDASADASRPHAYRPMSAGWFGALTPVGWSRSLLGASQLGQATCVVCRAAKDDPIHAPQAVPTRSDDAGA